MLLWSSWVSHILHPSHKNKHVHKRRYDIQAIHTPNAHMMPANGIKRQMLHHILGAKKCNATSLE
jgi:hypothetical protein